MHQKILPQSEVFFRIMGAEKSGWLKVRSCWAEWGRRGVGGCGYVGTG